MRQTRKTDPAIWGAKPTFVRPASYPSESADPGVTPVAIRDSGLSFSAFTRRSFRYAV